MAQDRENNEGEEEFKYGVLFTAMGILLLLLVLLAATRSVKVRCLGITVLLTALTLCSVARYEKYKREVCLIPIDWRVSKEMVWA